MSELQWIKKYNVIKALVKPIGWCAVITTKSTCTAGAKWCRQNDVDQA